MLPCKLVGFYLFISQVRFKLGLVGLCVLTNFMVSAQRLDSLEAALEQEKDVAKRIALLKAVGEGKMNELPKEAIPYFEELVAITPPQRLNLEALPKNSWLPRNGLKGKPFSERVRIGLHAAVQNTSDTLIVDFFPNVSYYLTGRVELGAGLIYRIREVKATWQLDQKNPVWGFSGFSTFKLSKGIRWRLEADAASYALQSANSEQAPIRIWRWTWLTGIQTNFNISNRWLCQGSSYLNQEAFVFVFHREFVVL